MNALTIDPIVNMAKIVAKLKPIKAANACRNSCSPCLLKLSLANAKAKIATRGAKITIHFSTPVKKNCISSGVVPTK
jgi:hypothetical protein